MDKNPQGCLVEFLSGGGEGDDRRSGALLFFSNDFSPQKKKMKAGSFTEGSLGSAQERT